MLTILLVQTATAQQEGGIGDRGVDSDTSQADDQNTSGGSEGNENIYAQVEIVWDETHNGPGGDGGGAVTPVSDWEPPPCWYGPAYTPDKFEELARRVFFAMVHDPDGQDIASDFMDKYSGGNPYHDFNRDKAGEGYWWDDFYDETRMDDPAVFDCTEPWFWIDTGEPPPVEYENAVTPEVLAELAYDRLRIPRDEATLRPEAAEQKVNLPTWMWLDEGTFRPVAPRGRRLPHRHRRLHRHPVRRRPLGGVAAVRSDVSPLHGEHGSVRADGHRHLGDQLDRHRPTGPGPSPPTDSSTRPPRST